MSAAAQKPATADFLSVALGSWHALKTEPSRSWRWQWLVRFLLFLVGIAQNPSDCPLSCRSEFDIDKGNTISCCYPTDFDFTRFDETHLADLCLPDGAHIHTTDYTFLFLHPSSPDASYSLKSASAGSFASREALRSHDSSVAGRLIYGVSMYKKKVDTSARRGAVQRAALILTKIAAFDSMESIARILVDAILVRRFLFNPRQFF